MNGFVTVPYPYPGGRLTKNLAINTLLYHQEPGPEGLEGPSSWWICISELVLTSKALGQTHGIQMMCKIQAVYGRDTAKTACQSDTSNLSTLQRDAFIYNTPA